MRALDTIKSTKFEAGIQYLSVYLFFSQNSICLSDLNQQIIVTVQQFATHAKLEMKQVISLVNQ